MANNYIADSVIGAIDTVVKGAIRDLKYDQTIEAIVTSTSKATDGIYTVKSENASFEAYSSERYYVNDTVYVMIPQGDFNKQKFITGRKVDSQAIETTFTLKLPFDDFIGLKHLTDGFDLGTKGFVANHGKHIKDNYLCQGSIIANEEILDKTIISNGKTKQDIYNDINLLWSWEKTDNSTTIETKLAVSVDVQSLLAAYRPSRGRFGFRLLITGMSKSTETTSSREITEEVFFTNDDMYGNTYAYTVPAVQ